ncbi:hypothetical protein [Streptomyces sp. NPDC097619]|uniref:hypothetical protein n=1 Tax=Streptomyces sp. NPDC097619 TaxID=3157228 RepID=UPI003324C532
MSAYPPSGPPQTTTLRQRLAELRGPAVPPRPLDARALAALAANPGCRRRALLDGAGVDKTALAAALGSPSSYGQSQFALVRGNSFEARVKAEGGAELLRLVREHLGADAGPAPAARVPDLTAAGPEGRFARTQIALREATAAAREGSWTLLDHPMLVLDVAGTPAYLEPDAVVVRPGGHWTVVEIKSFPMIDGAADPAKVGAAARQAAVYTLALERVAGLTEGAAVDHGILLVCPKDFSNLPTAAGVDIRKQAAVTRRQLARLVRVEELAEALPAGTVFDPALPRPELTRAVSAVTASYAPDCLAACELAFHCRDRAREAGDVTALGRGLRAELGTLTTVEAALTAAHSCPSRRTTPGTERPADTDPADADPAEEDPTARALRRAARLRAEALAEAAARPPRPRTETAPCPS